MKDLYKTVGKFRRKSILDMAADRGAYICQSQSLNVHMQDPNFGKTDLYALPCLEEGLKTGYVLPAHQSAASPSSLQWTSRSSRNTACRTADDQNRSDMACSLDNPDACEACGS